MSGTAQLLSTDYLSAAQQIAGADAVSGGSEVFGDFRGNLV